MDTGEIAIVAAIGVGFLANLIAIFALIRQSRSESRSESRELRSELLGELRELRNSFGERISEVEREQARLEGANGVLSEVLKQQSHTHEASAD